MFFAQLASIQGNLSIVKFGELTTLFPNISFSSFGPEETWLSENSVKPVLDTLPYDAKTQKLIPVAPYIMDDNVISVQVTPLTNDELEEVKTQELLTFAKAVQIQLDAIAKERDFFSIEDAASYALSSDAAWAAEAQAAITWRDAMWKEYYALADKVKAGQEVPNVTEFIEALPAIVWP
jgi:hypothetical protein